MLASFLLPRERCKYFITRIFSCKFTQTRVSLSLSLYNRNRGERRKLRGLPSARLSHASSRISRYRSRPYGNGRKSPREAKITTY